MKRNHIFLCLFLFISIIIIHNCESPLSSGSSLSEEQGFFRLMLTDAPLDLSDVEAIYITVSEVAVKKASSDNYIVVLDEETEFELLELKDNPQPLVETYLEAGHYTGIRLVVESARIIIGGVEYELRVPSMEIKINVEFDVTEDGEVSVTLDFDAENSIHVAEAGQSGLFILKPVILVDDISYE